MRAEKWKQKHFNHGARGLRIDQEQEACRKSARSFRIGNREATRYVSRFTWLQLVEKRNAEDVTRFHLKLCFRVSATNSIWSARNSGNIGSDRNSLAQRSETGKAPGVRPKKAYAFCKWMGTG